MAEFSDPGTGRRKRVRIGKTLRDGEEAVKKALDEFADAQRAVQRHAEARTIGQLWEMWLFNREADGFRNDILQAQWVALKPVFGHRDPRLLTEQDCRDYAKARFALGRAQWTVHHELVNIRTLMKWAAERHYIELRPKVWVPKRGRHRSRVLSFAEATALVAAASYGDPHVHMFVLIAFATAARHMAILDLTWTRVDFINGYVEFDEDIPPDPMNKSWRKGRAKVLMGRALRTPLELAHKGRQTDYVIEHGARRLKSVRIGFAAAVKRAKLDQSRGKITPHTIRHTVLTWLDEAGVGSDRRAQIAGHKDERTTKLVYTHSSPEVLAQAVEVLDEVLDALPQITREPTTDEPQRRAKARPLSHRDKPDARPTDGDSATSD